MNSATKWLVGLVTVLVLANIGLAASIWLKKEDAAKPPELRSDARDYLVKSLALNEAQVMTFDSLRRGHFERMRGYKDAMRQLKDSLFGELKKPGSPRAASVAEQIGRLQATIDLETYNHFSGLRALLNTEQAAKFDSTIQEVLRTLAPRDGPPRRGEGPEPGDRRGPPPGEGPGGPPDGPPR